VYSEFFVKSWFYVAKSISNVDKEWQGAAIHTLHPGLIIPMLKNIISDKSMLNNIKFENSSVARKSKTLALPVIESDFPKYILLPPSFRNILVDKVNLAMATELLNIDYNYDLIPIKDFQKISTPCVIRNSFGGLHTILIPSVFPPEFCQSVFGALKYYNNFKKSTHGYGQRYFGVHCDSTAHPIASSDIKICLEYFQYLLPLHEQLGNVVDSINKQFKFPGKILEKLDCIAPAWKLFGRTLTSQWINISSTTPELARNLNSHKDTKNLPNTLTWVFVFGEFTGGDVLLRNCGLRLCCPNGSVYGFLADQEEHCIDDITSGDRISIVNFTHANILQIHHNAPLYNLDPWLMRNEYEQNHSVHNGAFDFSKQLSWTKIKRKTSIYSRTN